MTRLEVVARAKRCIGKGIKYKLGRGGFNPKASGPGAECDCSGFVAWCYGVSRVLKDHPAYIKWNGGWFETTAVERDLLSELGIVEEVGYALTRPGDLVVVGDRGKRQGHIGIISAGPPDVKVIHCSSGNMKRSGDAVAETGLWAPKEELLFGSVQWVEDRRNG